MKRLPYPAPPLNPEKGVERLDHAGPSKVCVPARIPKRELKAKGWRTMSMPRSSSMNPEKGVESQGLPPRVPRVLHDLNPEKGVERPRERYRRSGKEILNPEKGVERSSGRNILLRSIA